MIPKEFKQTTLHSEEYDNYMAQFDFEDTPDELNHLPPLEEQQKQHEESDEYRLQELIKVNFAKEYKKNIETNTYFLGCNYAVYSSTYKARLQSFKDLYIDAEEHNFITEELFLITRYQFIYLIEDNLKKNIKYSLEKTDHFLKEKLKSLGYEIENTKTKDGKVNSIAVKGNSIIKFDSEPIVDLSDSKPIDTIRALGLIGFFDYIRDREPNLSINQTASLISAITGINQQTVQPYINPILSPGVSQNKNPFENAKKVSEVKRQLINIGIKDFKTF